MLLIASFLGLIAGCDIDLVTDTVFYEIPTYPAYYVEPCCYDYMEIYY